TKGRAQRQNQNLAFSEDGVTWKKYAGNPVLDLGLADFRDPKVFWHAPSKRWVMVAVLAEQRKATFYASPNLKTWTHLSDFGPAGATGGVWECPDLFALGGRWVLKIGLNPGHVAGGSGEQYFVGSFDGVRFHNESGTNEPLWVDYGRDCYCESTWNDDRSGEVHAIGWMSNWQYAGRAPTSPWRGAMTLPRSLALNANGRLLQTPVAALRSVRGEAFDYEGRDVEELNRKLEAWPHRSQTFELEATIQPGTARSIAWKLLAGEREYTLVGFDAAEKRIVVDRMHSAHTDFSPQFPSRTTAPLDIGGGPLALHVFVDRSSIEVFAAGGRVVLTNLVFPNPDSTGISLTVDGGVVDKAHVQVWNLR
ncbi:MAG TPA: GH32 C-terminal domain-containing protein, partial [Bryobacteraceae bacterium]|nr:GH32 C-terminal domain-containing protein [Bryobacteraceae bacterium]